MNNIERDERDLSLIVLYCTQKGAHTARGISPGPGVTVCVICVRVHMTGKMVVKCPGLVNRAAHGGLWNALPGCKPVHGGATRAKMTVLPVACGVRGVWGSGNFEDQVGDYKKSEC